MNHCLTCGSKVSRGRTHKHTDTNVVRCLICAQARVLRDWRYVSPSVKRWRKRKGQGA